MMADNQNNNYLDSQAIVQQFSVTIIPKKEKEYGDQSPSHECYSGENCALNIKCWNESISDPEILAYKQEIEEEDATAGKEESHGQTAADSVSHQMQLHPSLTFFKFQNHRHPIQGDCPKVEGATGTTPNIDPGCVPNVKTGEAKRKAEGGSSAAQRASSTQSVHATSTHKVGTRNVITPHSNKSFLYVVKTKGSEVQKRKGRTKTVLSSWLIPNFKKSTFKKPDRDFPPTKKIPILSSNCSVSHYRTQPEPRRLRRRTLPNNCMEDSKNCHRCVECSLNMETRYHFRKYMKCSKCQYSTSCGVAFTNHMREFHSALETRQEASSKRERRLKFYCLCVCGFVSSYGNRTANHVLKCPEKSCYCTPEAEKVSNVSACEDLESSPGGLLIGEPVKKVEEDSNELRWNTIIKLAPSSIAESVVIDHALQRFPMSPRCSRGRKKKKQRWDALTEISNEEMKLQITDTFDIVTTRQELAPPTRKLMRLKERGSVEALLTLPGRASNSRMATKLFLKNSKTRREDVENPF